LHFLHFTAPFLQQSADPLNSPHDVHIFTLVIPFGILQQPGEPFTRPHFAHLTCPCLQQASVPLTWPHFIQRATAAGDCLAVLTSVFTAVDPAFVPATIFLPSGVLLLHPHVAHARADPAATTSVANILSITIFFIILLLFSAYS
jgi:hypothetical protein